MKAARDIAGYFMGLVLFVVLIPLLMWKISGDVHPGTARIGCSAVLAAAGIGLSVWSIVYMKRVGKGNPMDAFNREEKRLKEDFGKAYIDYCKKTKKLISYIW